MGTCDSQQLGVVPDGGSSFPAGRSAFSSGGAKGIGPCVDLLHLAVPLRPQSFHLPLLSEEGAAHAFGCG